MGPCTIHRTSGTRCQPDPQLQSMNLRIQIPWVPGRSWKLLIKILEDTPNSKSSNVWNFEAQSLLKGKEKTLISIFFWIPKLQKYGRFPGHLVHVFFCFKERSLRVSELQQIQFVVSCSSLVFSSSGTCQKGTLGDGPSPPIRKISVFVNLQPFSTRILRPDTSSKKKQKSSINETIPITYCRIFNQQKSFWTSRLFSSISELPSLGWNGTSSRSTRHGSMESSGLEGREPAGT